MYELRSYQKEAVDKALEFFADKKNKKPALMVLPTGSGKSLCLANIAKELQEPVLIFQPSKELLEQNYEKYISYGYSASIFSASKNSREISDVTFATIGSVKSYLEKFKTFKYVLVDEAHLISPKEESMYSKFFESVNVRLLGLTATPIRLKSYNFPEKHSKLGMLNRQIPKVFSYIIHVTQIKELYSFGFLSPLKYVQDLSDLSKLEINSTGADYTEESLQKFEEEQEICKKIALGCQKTPDRKHVLIFVPTCIQAEKMTKYLPGCAMVSSQTPKKERADIIQKFKSGQINYVANVGIFSIGFDYPEIDMIVDAKPTLSLARYYQMLGRGIRPHPSKKNCLVVDLVGNFKKFGRIEDLIIKDDPKDGWGIYSNDKLLTGVPMYIQ